MSNRLSRSVSPDRLRLVTLQLNNEKISIKMSRPVVILDTFSILTLFFGQVDIKIYDTSKVAIHNSQPINVSKLMLQFERLTYIRGILHKQERKPRTLPTEPPNEAIKLKRFEQRKM